MRVSLIRRIAWSALSLILTPTPALTTAQQITLPDGGRVTGTLETDVAGEQIQVYRGIPYAEPPVGERRWKQATLKPLRGDVDATAYGNVCYNDPRTDARNANFPTSEDCLFVNVYTPVGVTQTSKLKVMVWIHGGAFVAGSALWYSGTNLVGAVDTQIVYVSLSYRLSVFGFLASDALKAEGDGVNFGVRDQETAFQWVRQHIALFGGDPQDITIFGESAGAKSVYAHLIARDGNQQLFQRAITQSGTYTTAHDMPTLAKQNSVASQIATQVGCSSSADLACLRAANASAVWAAGGSLGWQPVVDNVFLLDAPFQRVLDGKVSAVPTIHGTNTDEGWLFTSSVTTTEAVFPYVRSRFSTLTDDELTRLEKLYPAANFPTANDHVSEIYGDAIYVCPSELSSLQQARHGHPTFRYRFNQTTTLLGQPRAIHTAELIYVFNNVTAVAQDTATQTFVHDMQRYWKSFALHNSPNGEPPTSQNCVDQSANAAAADAIQWPAYDASARQQILLQASGLSLETTGAYMPLHADRCAFWHAVEQRLAPSLAG